MGQDATVYLTALGMGVTAPPTGAAAEHPPELKAALKEQDAAFMSKDLAWQRRASRKVENLIRLLGQSQGGSGR